MKYLIFSDTHLTPQFDSRKFTVLKEAIEQADRVIINGDFWEGYNKQFDAFADSYWSKTLFPLLKKKKTIYLFGNHDAKEFVNLRVSLFSDEQKKNHVLKSGKNIFYITHGDEIYPLPDFPAWVVSVLNFLEDSMFKLFGNRFIKLAYSRMNKAIKKKIRGKYKDNEFLVMGHTHCEEIDLPNNFINDGCIKHGFAQYIFIEDGVVTAVEKKY